MNPEPEPEYWRNASLPETEPKDSDFLPTAEKTIAELLPEWSKAIKEWGVSPVWSGCSLRLTILSDINVAMETCKTSAYR